MKNKMKPIMLFVLTVALIIGGNAIASEQKKDTYIPPMSQQYLSKTLRMMGIEVDKKLENLITVHDQNGEQWIFVSFVRSDLVSDQIAEKYSTIAETSFIITLDDFFDEVIQEGDTVPVLLLTEDFSKVKMAFLRNWGKGDLISADFVFDPKTLTYKMVSKHSEQKKDTYIPPMSQQYQSKTLKTMGIEVDKQLENLITVHDQNGEEWLFVSFVRPDLISDQIAEKYSTIAETSFNITLDNFVDKVIQEGDTVPVLLLTEDFSKVKMAFLRDWGKGDLISADFVFDPKTLTYKMVSKSTD